MKARKLIGALMVTVMIVSLCACGESGTLENTSAGRSLYEQGLDVISLMATATTAHNATIYAPTFR